MSFGRVKLDPLMLAVDTGVFARTDIDSADIAVRYFRFTVDKNRHQIPTEEIPNADVLLALLRKE